MWIGSALVTTTFPVATSTDTTVTFAICWISEVTARAQWSQVIPATSKVAVTRPVGPVGPVGPVLVVVLLVGVWTGVEVMRLTPWGAVLRGPGDGRGLRPD